MFAVTTGGKWFPIPVLYKDLEQGSRLLNRQGSPNEYLYTVCQARCAHYADTHDSDCQQRRFNLFDNITGVNLNNELEVVRWASSAVLSFELGEPSQGQEGRLLRLVQITGQLAPGHVLIRCGYRPWSWSTAMLGWRTLLCYRYMAVSSRLVAV